MPLSMAKNLQVHSVSGQSAAIGAAGPVFIPVARRGRITGGSISNSAAVTGSDIVLTLSKLGDGAEKTLGTFTVPLAGTAAGNVAPLSLSASGGDIYVQPGQTLKVDKTSGGAGGGVGQISIDIKGS